MPRQTTAVRDVRRAVHTCVGQISPLGITMRSISLATLAIVLMAIGGSMRAHAQTDTWVTTGALAEGRLHAASASLPDGRALIVGGSNESGFVASAEIYDPATGAWSSAGSLTTPREWLKAVTLLDGRVLVTGGEDGGWPIFDTVELYDPTTNTWSLAAPMQQARTAHTITLLSDGRVLVTGGYGGEIYDPNSDSWSLTPDMAHYKFEHTATLLPNGKVLVVGYNVQPELYDPSTNTWSPAGTTLGPARAYHTATLLANGQVLVAGGVDSSLGLVALAEVYDPASNAWSPAGYLNNPRLDQGAARLPDGRVIVLGGTDLSGPYPLDSTEVYDPNANAWSIGPSMPDGRKKAEVVSLRDGQVLVAGGEDVTHVRPTTAFLYTPVSPDPAAYLVADYPFSGDANDRGPYGMNGVNHGATLTSDRRGSASSAYYFNGSAYIDIPGGAALNGMSSFTLSAWINTVIKDNGVILSKASPNRDFALSLSWVGGGSVNAQFAHDATYYHCWATEPKVPANTWTHLTAVWTGSAWRLYINGALSMERVVNGPAPLWTGTSFQIGALVSAYGRFVGSIDDVRIYSKALSEAEIQWLMAQ
jgi:hypothetical protein